MRRTRRMPDPTLDPEAPRDGRNVLPDVGALSGEGAGQRVRRLETHALHRELPEHPERGALRAEPEEEGPSYHGMPVLREPVWEWMIPAYFFAGGLAGSCAVLAAAARGAGGRGTARLVARCRLVAAGGALASAALLVADLGRPARFLNMLRVFRPTSPMNLGTWILAPFGALSGLAALPALLPGAPRAVRRAADAAAYGAGALGLPLVGYTGVLIANTAVPVWQATRHTLPVLFAFSGAVSAGGLLQLWPPGGAGGEMGRRFGVAAKGAELLLSLGLDAEAARSAPRVARPLHRGGSGALLQAARLLVAASLAADLLPGRRRRRALSGALALAGTLALRFGIFFAGRASARDPHATFQMQRRGRGAVEVARESAPSASMPSVPGVEATGKESFDAGGSA
jgi:formate-dependent nitrite reductase membrane component NrfD